jgi:hypothetical protein
MDASYHNFKKEVIEHLKNGWLLLGKTELQQKIIDANQMIFEYQYMQAITKRD